MGFRDNSYQNIYKQRVINILMTEKINSNEIKGKWVILLDEHVIASGDDIKEIIKEAQEKYPNKRFILAKVPEEGTMIY